MASDFNAAFDHQIWYADGGANSQWVKALILSIQHTRYTPLLVDNHTFHMKNILYCTNASANILSINNKWIIIVILYWLVVFFFLWNRIGPTEYCSKVELRMIYIGNKSFSNKLHYFAAKLGSKTNKKGLHDRLGHLFDLVLHSLFQSGYHPSNSFNKIAFCESLSSGKGQVGSLWELHTLDSRSIGSYRFSWWDVFLSYIHRWFFAFSMVVSHGS